jgi:predicted SAM-dependent methyltransferase
MVLRDRLRDSGRARKVYKRVVLTRSRAVNGLLGWLTLDRLPRELRIRYVYQILLGREPDPSGLLRGLVDLRRGGRSTTEFVDGVRGSEEYAKRGFSGSMLKASVHAGRCEWVRSLPRARRIVDLGGTHLSSREGALVSLGYPYHFDELTVVELPSDDRHAIYRGEQHERVETRLGPVTYRYHSMTDLSDFPDSSVDLVYSGQSIEHVHPEEAALMLKSVNRILRSGGHLALDTPNRRVTRLQQSGFIDPDHKVEYTWQELRELIVDAGLEVETVLGVNYAGGSLTEGRFNPDDVANNYGLYHEVEDCYIIAVLARKPV